MRKLCRHVHRTSIIKRSCNGVLDSLGLQEMKLDKASDKFIVKVEIVEMVTTNLGLGCSTVVYCLGLLIFF